MEMVRRYRCMRVFTRCTTRDSHESGGESRAEKVCFKFGPFEDGED